MNNRASRCLSAVLVLALALIPGMATAQTSPQAPQSLEQQRHAAGVAAWRQALEHMRANEPRAALSLLERLVTLAPGDYRIRLELARAYFLIEDDEKARFHFDQASGADLRPEERLAVARYQDRIEARRRWEANFSFAMVPESNPGRRTSAETVAIGGLDWVLDEQADSATGLETSGRLTYLPRLSRDVSGRISTYFSGRFFENSALNDITLGTEIGLLARADRGRVFGGGLSASRRWLGSSGFSQAVGLYGTAETRVGPRVRLGLRADLDRVTHDYLPGRDGHRARLRLSFSRAMSPQLMLRGSAQVRRTRAQDASASGLELGVSAGATYAFAGGLVTSVDVDWLRDRRDGVSPVFDVTREDRQTSLALGILHRSLEFGGFAPRLSVHLERRRSSIELFSYDNARVSLGVTRSF
ncbi:MAG: surface lipoprotein assembly modifier [Pararhodobacter sp.]